jgi:hypothetical protein
MKIYGGTYLQIQAILILPVEVEGDKMSTSLSRHFYRLITTAQQSGCATEFVRMHEKGGNTYPCRASNLDPQSSTPQPNY